MTNVSFTGWSNTLGTGAANVGAESGAIQNEDYAGHDAKLASILRRGIFRPMRSVLYGLIGAAAGGTVTENRTRVKAKVGTTDKNALGGSVELESAYYLGSSTSGRATTAGDVTALKAIIDRAFAPSSYVSDASGNGGGGKAGV